MDINIKIKVKVNLKIQLVVNQNIKLNFAREVRFSQFECLLDARL